MKVRNVKLNLILGKAVLMRCVNCRLINRLVLSIAERGEKKECT